MDCRESERIREYVFYFLSISEIQSCEIIEGDLHSRADRMVREWTQWYQAELLDMWKSQQFKRLPGWE